MKRNSFAFPVSLRSRDKEGVVFEHEVVGGLSIRDYMAIEFAAAMFSNPALPAAAITHPAVLKAALLQADNLIELLGED